MWYLFRLGGGVRLVLRHAEHVSGAVTPRHDPRPLFPLEGR
jgi:hypothetical protein